MAGIFGKSKELETQLQVMRQEAEAAQERCRAGREELQEQVIRGLTNMHLYGQLALEDAESAVIKENLKALLSECERLLEAMNEKE